MIENALVYLLNRAGYHRRHVPHGFRAAFSTIMNEWARTRVEQLAREDLDGYVLKSKSPSCGGWSVKVTNESGSPASDGRGLFASALIERFPLLPVEEEGRLADPAVRRDFIERVIAYRRRKEDG